MPKRVDANQKEIVKRFRGWGATVLHLHTVGQGCPDLLIGWGTHNMLCEVKDPAQPPSKRKLTPAQRVFHNEWHGKIYIVETTNDVDNVIKEMSGI